MTWGRKLAAARLEGSEAGFSLIELLIVIAMVVILTTISVFALRNSKRSYAPDDEAKWRLCAQIYLVKSFRGASAAPQNQARRTTTDVRRRMGLHSLYR